MFQQYFHADQNKHDATCDLCGFCQREPNARPIYRPAAENRPGGDADDDH